GSGRTAGGARHRTGRGGVSHGTDIGRWRGQSGGRAVPSGRARRQERGRAVAGHRGQAARAVGSELPGLARGPAGGVYLVRTRPRSARGRAGRAAQRGTGPDGARPAGRAGGELLGFIFISGGALTPDYAGSSRPPLKPPSLVAALRAPPSSTCPSIRPDQLVAGAGWRTASGCSTGACRA